MPDDGCQIVRVTNQELQTMRFDEALEHYVPDLATALPDHIQLDRFKRVVLTAVNQNPALARADRRSLFNSCSRCAHDGLYPDGREAALVVFSTKVKRKVPNDNGVLVETEYYADLVQYLPMIAGIRKRMRNTGEVLSADAQIVCRNDKFHYEFGDDPKIVHEPPSLGTERGETVGAYAIIKLANGEVLREVMSRQQIERVRQMSRAKDGPAWKNSWDEMARKTVLKRCSKAAPTGAELERLLARDDEIPHAHADAPLREIPPRPRQEDYLQIDNGEPAGEGPGPESRRDEISFEVVDPDGEVHDEYATAEAAQEALLEFIGTAARRSRAALDGLWESNAGTVTAIGGAIEDGAEPLHQAYAEAQRAFEHSKARPISTSAERRETISAIQSDGAAAPRDQSKTAEHTQRERQSRPPQDSLAVPPVKEANGAVNWQATTNDMIDKISKITNPNDCAGRGRFREENIKTLDAMRARPELVSLYHKVEYHLRMREGALRSGDA